MDRLTRAHDTPEGAKSCPARFHEDYQRPASGCPRPVDAPKSRTHPSVEGARPVKLARFSAARRWLGRSAAVDSG
jgi:hypothetical protein